MWTKGYLPVTRSVWAELCNANDPLMQQFKAIFGGASGVRTRPSVPPLSSDLLASEQLAGVLDVVLASAEAVQKSGEAAMAEYERQSTR